MSFVTLAKMLRMKTRLLLLFFWPLFFLAQIQRGGGQNAAIDSLGGKEKKIVKGERPVNCNEDLELDPDNHLIFHRKTQKPYTGLCISYHPNGKLQRRVRFKNGKETDTSYAYYESGRIMAILINVEGVENGTWGYWYDTVNQTTNQSQLAWANTYDMGVKTGEWFYFNADGTAKKTLRYKNDQLHGLCQYYHPNGDIKKSIDYQDGVFEGKYITYFEDSIVKMNKLYKNGKPDGKASYYYKTGALSYEAEYSNGQKTGKWTFFYDNGQIKKQGNYKENKEDGLWEFFLDDGKNSASVLYNEGIVRKAVEYDRFGKPKKDEDLIELNQLLSKGKAKEGDRKKKDKKKKGERSNEE